MTDLRNPIFYNEEAAREHFEAIRWPQGPFCPHCGNADPDQIHKINGKSHRPGLHQCYACREHFTVTVGSVMERSKVPLTKWALAFHLMNASKKGMSAHQLHRMLGVTYKTAWFMAHRIREAMKDNVSGPLGGEGQTVEADETYHGKKDRVTTWTKHGKPGLKSKRPVVALVERGGRTKMFYVENVTAENVRDVLVRNVNRKSALHTDESPFYTRVGSEFEAHRTVHHSSGEYVRYEPENIVHTNTVENVFSVLKRGLNGTYQHVGEAHLHRYLAEFEFRHNNRAGLGIQDTERTANAIRGAAGKRLTYHQSREAAHA